MDAQRPMSATTNLQLRRPQLTDGAAAQRLVANSPPLDHNSDYLYFLLCSHFADSCVVAEAAAGEMVAFLSAYRKPSDPDVLFIWQVAVAAAYRGQGIGNQLLDHLLQRPACVGVRWLESTVSPSNQPSRRLFERFAAAHSAGWQESIFLDASQFGDSGHETELLFRIGPLHSVGS